MTPFFSDSNVFSDSQCHPVLKEHLDIFGKYAHLLSCRGSDEKINTTLKS